MSAPFHSSLLQPAAEPLAKYMDALTFASPRIRVVNNVDVALVEDPQAIKDALARQSYNPVRWVEVIRAIAGEGVTDIVECGPGKVLAGLVKRIDPNLSAHAMTDTPSLAQTLEMLR